MATYRLQIATWYDSLSPKDAVVIDPTFNIAQPLGGEDDPQQLCDDLALAMKTWTATTNQIRTRAYLLPYVRGAGHVGESFQNSGVAGPSSGPRELAVCLSFYSDHNKPRYRGRVYVPHLWLGAATTNRPSSGAMTTAGNLSTVFTALGGINVDWSIWSVRDATHRVVTNWWVDNEYDVVRSRGLLPTSRILGTTTEDNPPNRVALVPSTEDT